MSLTYDTWQQQLANLMVVSSGSYQTDYAFQTFVQSCIDYAEQRLYRELDLLATRVTDTSGSFTANQRTFAYPTTIGSFLVIEEISALTPFGAGASSGTRVPLQVASKQFIDMMYPNNMSGTGVPRYFNPYTSSACIIGPVPDQAYQVEVIGTQRPTPLSSNNQTTFLTQVLPDLWMAASMVFASGYMRDFGAQTDNPNMGVAWQAQYDKLFASAMTEELRKKYGSQAWQSEVPNPVATPPRV